MFSKSTAKDTPAPGANPKSEPATPTPGPAPVQASTPAPTPVDPGLSVRKGPRVASLIAEQLTIEGSVSGDGELQIDGTIRGDVRMGKVTIGDSGHVEGSVQAEVIEVRGRVVGVMTAKQVRLNASAYVDGDITHEQLSIEAGAFFQGRSLKFQRPVTATAAPQPAPAPAREPVSAAASSEALAVPTPPADTRPSKPN